VKGWRDRLAGRRADSLPIELPPHRDQEGWRRPVDGEPRLVAPPAPRTPLPRLAARIAVGSVGLALAAGVIVGRMTAVETSSASGSSSRTTRGLIGGRFGPESGVSRRPLSRRR